MTVEVTYAFEEEVLTFPDVSDTHTRDGVYVIVQQDQITRIPLANIRLTREFYD